MSLRSFLAAVLLLPAACVNQLSAQVYSHTFACTADTYTSSAAPSSTLGATQPNNTLNVRATVTPTASADLRRGYMNFSLMDATFPTGIPKNARIISATLTLTISSEGSSPTFAMDRVPAVWAEADLTHTNAAGLGTYIPITIDGMPTPPKNKRQITLTTEVQAIVSGLAINRGWRIRHLNETTANSVNCMYYTKEDATPANRPVLDVQWYVPSQVTNAIIDHASSTSANDGSIIVSTTAGSDSPTFQWYTSAGAVIPGATGLQLSGVSYGWYGLKMTDQLGDTYMAFLIGVDCQEVSIPFDPGPNYIQDALLVNTNSTTNYGANGQFYAINGTSGGWYSAKSIAKFNVWVDPVLDVAEAKLKLSGIRSTPNAIGRSNAAEFVQVTQPWEEMTVTWSTMPAVSSNIRVDVPVMTQDLEIKQLEIRDFWNKWKHDNTLNYGMIMQLLLYDNTYATQNYNSSDAATASLRPMINFKVGSSFCATWDTATESGTVVLNVGSIPVKTGPYHYRISQLPILSMKDSYKFLKDSVYGGVLDSTLFFKGTVTGTTYQFNDLSLGTYFAQVFDSRGERILDQAISVQPLTFISQSGLHATGTFVKGTSATAMGDIALYPDEKTAGQLDFTIYKLSGTQNFGCVEMNKPISGSSDIRYGFSLVEDKLYTVVNSIKSSNFVATITPGTILTISFGNGIELLSNGALVATGAAPASFQFKPAVYLNANSLIRVSGRQILTAVRAIQITGVSHGNCDLTTGSIEFKLSPFFSLFTNPTISYKINNIGQQLVIPYIPLTTVSIASVQTPISHTSVPPGKYSITGTITAGTTSYPFSEVVYVGVLGNWPEAHPNYLLTPNENSVQRDNLNSGSYSQANSRNVLNVGENGWVLFQPVATVSFSNHNYLRFNYGPSYSSPLNSEVFLDFTKYVQVPHHFPSSNPILIGPIGPLSPFALVPKIRMIWNSGNQQSGVAYLPMNTTLLLKFEDLTISVYSTPSNLIATLPRPQGVPIRLRANSLKTDEGFDNVVTSFNCYQKQALNNISHMELQREQEAGYATVVENTLKFTFDEEYQIQSGKYLSYKIFDSNHQPLAGCTSAGVTSGGAVQQAYRFDDNRYSLSVSGISGLAINQYYFLEVYTTTGETRYLKFIYKY